jgi:hypothetical protein
MCPTVTTKEKMRELVSAGRRRLRTSRHAEVRGKHAVSNAVELMEKRMLYSAFQPGDIAVYRVGTGSTAIPNASAPVFIDEYSAGGTVVQTINLPTAVSGSNNPLTASSSTNGEGQITLSSNGQYLLVPGYDSVPGVSNISYTASASPAVVNGTIKSATVATPAVITTSTTATAAGFVNGQQITIPTSIGTVPAGTYYLKLQTSSATAFALYSDAALTQPVVGQSTTFASGSFSTTAVAAVAPREVGVISSTGSIDTTTTLGTALSTYEIVGAASADGTNIYATGGGLSNSTTTGLFYTTDGSTSNATGIASISARDVEIVNGQLYISANYYNAPSQFIDTVGTGLPTTGSQTLTQIPGLADGAARVNVGGPYAFAFATLNGGSAPDTLYVADLYNYGIDKFSLVNGSWVINGEAGGTSSGSLSKVTSLIAQATPGGEMIFASTPTNIYSIADNAGYNAVSTSFNTASPTLTTVATAASGYQFRGIAFVPQPGTAPTIAAASQPANFSAIAGQNATFTSVAGGANVSVQWQTSTGGSAPFTNIPGAIYTTYTVPNTTVTESGYKYRAVFTNTYGTATSNAATLTVTALPYFSFDMASYSVNENANPATVTIKIDRGGDTSSQVSVNYSTGALTATSPADFGSESGTLVFPSATNDVNGNSLQQSITVPISPQYTVAGGPGNLTFNLTLSSPVNSNSASSAVLGPQSTTTVTIVDTQEVFNVSSGAYSINDTESNGIIDVVRSVYLADSASVPIAVTGASSYSGTVNFAANQSVAAVTIPISSLSSTQTATITLGTPTATTGYPTLGALNTSTATIVHVVAPANTTALSGAAATGADIQSSGDFTSSNFAAVVGDSNAGTGSFALPAYEVLEYSPSGSTGLYPTAGTTVNTSTGSLSNISLQLFNTGAAGGNYNGDPGDFSVYFINDSDATTPTTGLSYTVAAAPSGLSVSTGQFATAPTLLGTFSFNDAASGYDTYTLPSLPAAVEQALISDLNSSQPFRIAVTPNAYGIGAIAADWRGVFSGETPILSLAAAVTVHQTTETFGFSSATYSEPETGPATTITITRTGTNLTDSATIQYATTDGSAVAGTNYVATSGTAIFNANSSTATFTVPAIDAVPQGGDKSLTLTLSNPVTGNSAATVGLLGSQSTATLTVVDSTPPSQMLVANLNDSGNAETSGIYDDTEFKAGGPSASFPSFGIIDFQTTVAPAAPITAIDSITFTSQNVDSTTTGITAGPVDFYLATSQSPIVVKATTPYYQTSSGVEGVGTQEGTLYRLGTFNITDTGANDIVTIPISGFTQAAENALITYLNGDSQFRLLMTPESPSVNADFVPGDSQLSIAVQESSSSSLPVWLSPDSQATFSKSSETLTVTGPTTFVNDPSISGDQTVAITDTTGSAINFNVPAGTAVHAGSLTLSGSSTASLAASTNTLLILSTNTLSIDSSSKLNLGGNFLDVASGSLATIDGYIKNKQLTSSLLASNSLTSLGAVLNNTGASTTLISTIDGQSLAATDVVVKLTYLGDATLDGKVDASDYSRIDNGFLHGLTGWYNGDFNYDGVVNGSDYTLMDNAFNRQGAYFATPAAIIAPAVTAIPTPTPSPVTTDSFFSDKKVSESLVGEVEDVVTAVN